MGCLCGKVSEEEVIELSTITNSAVMCKCGKAGDKVEIKNNGQGYVVKGQGLFLGSCPLDCDTGRWEIHITKGAKEICVGVMRYKTEKGNNENAKKLDLNKAMTDYKDSSTNPAWCFDSTLLNDGDVVGVYWDQTALPMLSFTVNGKVVESQSVNRIRPSNDLFATVSLASNAECVVIFDESSFKYPPISSRFKMIICSTSLI